jgi:predicted transcriptional regulator
LHVLACTVSIDGIISPRLKLILVIPGADVISILTEKVSGELEMLERHLLILKQVVENEPIGILKLAEETNIPSHKVRYSLRVLEQEGLIKASAPGAVTTEQTVLFLEELEGMIEDLSRRSEELKKIKIER